MARTAQFTVHLNVLIGRSLADWLYDVAENEDRSVSEVVRSVLEEARQQW